MGYSLYQQDFFHQQVKSRWWFQLFFIFIPIWGRRTHFDEHIFQMGWFNHQPEMFPKFATSKSNRFNQPIGGLSDDLDWIFGPAEFWQWCLPLVLMRVLGGVGVEGF